MLIISWNFFNCIRHTNSVEIIFKKERDERKKTILEKHFKTEANENRNNNLLISSRYKIC